MKFSTISNIGKVRSENQDYYGNLELDKYSFFIVADGMRRNIILNILKILI